QAASSQPAPTQAASSQPAPSFSLAREDVLDGYYGQALEFYEDLATVPSRALRAAIARTEIDLQVGTYAEGIDRLEALSADGERSADWHAALADLLEQVGRYDEAVDHNRRALSIDADHYRGRWQLGRLYETLGRLDDAMKAYKPFDARITGERLLDDDLDKDPLPARAEDLTYLGRGFYRYSVLSRTNLVERTRHVLDSLFGEAIDFVDSRCLAARFAAAELLLEKHRADDAELEFKLIRSQNEKTPDAAVGLGRIALEAWDFEKAEGFSDAALDVNPNHVGGHLLLADTRMTERRFAAAAAAARKALKVNPNSIEALSVLAASEARRGKPEAVAKILGRVRSINARPAVFHRVLGAWLSSGRQFDEAEGHFKKAIEFAPAWSQPRTELGLLYMERGEETSAREMLEASFDLDRFNRRTYNVLELLDRLDRFDRVETEHFVVKYDAATESAVAPIFAETLEALYGDVCADFDHEPEHKTVVELFPRHDGFSIRIAGRPFIATVGACTGRVIAMQAPRGGPPFGRFNWASVLRHEFTHTVTLSATRNRIPHWFTEGLAVYEEIAPRRWDWKQMLSDAMRRERLFGLREIDWGFMRPRRPGDRTLAYAQSEWMVEFIVEKHGYAAILKLLEAFRDGKTQNEAFGDVLKTKTDAFSDAFHAWAAGQVKGWGLPTNPVESPTKIKLLLLVRSRDAELHARLAEAEYLDGEYEASEASAREALRIDRDQPKALEMLSHILINKMLSEKDESARRDLIRQAEPYIRRLNEMHPENPAGIRYAAYIEQARQQWRPAIRLLTEYQRRFPEDPDSFRRLAGIHLTRGKPESALRQLERLARLAEDEPAVPKRIAEMYVERDDPRSAADWLRRAIEIDPFDADTHLGRGEALLAAGDARSAEHAFKAACTLLPDDAAGYDGLSRVYKALGEDENAALSAAEAAARGG
ncbi:MAG: tetratricopeptide repeat protein, partial [Planctomycetota bacterium]|nr:tetratricopeptide repeat protein [Planctomycetota bacterium]